MKLNLSDLQPEEAAFTLSEYPGQIFIIKKFSLLAQIWMNKRFGENAIKGIFENIRIPDISELVFFLLKDKSIIKTLEQFQEHIVTQADKTAIVEALLKTIGISQPIMEQIEKDVTEGNVESLNQLIGAPSTTSSPLNTDTP